MSFAPDTLREPTYFVGQLAKRLPFREAISALHDVVISDLRFRPKDKTAYLAWVAEQEPLWVAEAMAQQGAHQAKIDALRKELQAVQAKSAKVMEPFYKAQQRYFKYLYKRDYEAWWVFDPVITVHPDELFFECFSLDESTYGKLGCNYNVFDNISEYACGTTNIDYSQALYNEFQKVREYKNTSLKVDPGGFDVQTTGEANYREEKIDLPDSWVRGFLQVSSAMTQPAATFDLHPMDVYNFCFILKRNKERKGPRSIRFVLEPGQPVKAIFDPWGLEVVCHRSPFTGHQPQTIRIWGRRRLLILERLIPIARKFRVSLLGSGMPSFFVADLGDMNFTLGLSGWTANDWSRQGAFDLMAPRGEVDGMTAQKIYLALRENWVETHQSLAKRLNLDEKVVLSALTGFAQQGKAIYDLNAGAFRLRELSREPLPLDQLRFSSPKEQEAAQLVNSGAVSCDYTTMKDGSIRVWGTIKEKHKTVTTSIIIDSDGRLTNQSTCSCRFYQQHKLMQGPCEHMLALRIASRDKLRN